MLLQHRPIATTSCTISRDEDGGLSAVVAGTLDQAGVRFIEAELHVAVATATSNIALDCVGCGFVDSSGLRLLIDLRRLAAARDVELSVTPSIQLRQLLELTGLTILLPATGGISLV